jgi:hypothetical protein|eukprot:COSAG01_NODE_9000_length_2587_cov_1.505627_2_plen_210_part_00
MATLATVARVPAAAIVHANKTGPKPMDSFDMSPLLFDDRSTCGAERLASPRKNVMYFFGDEHNGAWGSGDYKLVMGIDHKWGLWDQQYCLAANYSWPNRSKAQQDGQCDNPPGPAPCPSDSPCLFNVINDPSESHDLSSSDPERLARLLVEYRSAGQTECWRTDVYGCQSWTTAAQAQQLGEQTSKTLWSAPLGHAPVGWVPPTQANEL